MELTVVYFFYVETRNTPLEEIAKHFDGDRALVAGAAASEKGFTLAEEIGLDGTVTQHQDLEQKRNSVQVENAPQRSDL